MQIVDQGLICERKGEENPGTSAQIYFSFPFRIYFLLNTAENLINT
jgi:chromosome segregation and condensation protein ScpB